MVTYHARRKTQRAASSVDRTRRPSHSHSAVHPPMSLYGRRRTSASGGQRRTLIDEDAACARSWRPDPKSALSCDARLGHAAWESTSVVDAFRARAGVSARREKRRVGRVDVGGREGRADTSSRTSYKISSVFNPEPSTKTYLRTAAVSIS
jgi:hypothetical protein